ncbi:MAG: hypothetical protein HYX88_00050 [Chloroflexi bacterium]|nr:hypothetical protein [Chloroflexota bacterium]
MVSTRRAITLGLLQAIGLTLYCWGVATVLLNAGRWIPRPEPMLAIFFFLVFFVISAVISASIVLGYPAYLALNQRLGQGIKVLTATVAWLVLFLVIAVFTMLIGVRS